MKLRTCAALLLTTMLTGCFYGPGYEAAAYEGGAYDYVYYPDYGVYYYAPQQVWYWNDGGYWRYGAALPPSYPRMSTGVSVTLNSPRPYTQHDYVVRHYGGPRGPRSPGRDRDHDHD